MFDLGSTTFAGLVVRLAAGTLAVAVAWAVLIAAALVVEACSRGRVALSLRVGCPAGLRRMVLAACGVAVVAGAATAPSYATGERDALDGLPLPDRPTGRLVPAPAAPHVHVVRRGECLWTIAAERAPADPGRQVERIYRLNRRTIGADPDLIRPGQRLLLPADPDTTEEVDR